MTDIALEIEGSLRVCDLEDFGAEHTGQQVDGIVAGFTQGHQPLERALCFRRVVIFNLVFERAQQIGVAESAIGRLSKQRCWSFFHGAV